MHYATVRAMEFNRMLNVVNEESQKTRHRGHAHAHCTGTATWQGGKQYLASRLAAASYTHKDQKYVKSNTEFSFTDVPIMCCVYNPMQHL